MPEASPNIAAARLAWVPAGETRIDAPRRGAVDLWRVDLDQPFEDAELQRLTEVERARADSFRFARDRSRFISGRLAFNRVLARYVGEDAANAALQRTDAGQPLLTSPVQGLAVSFSRSEGRAVMAVAGGRTVGVDIEIVKAKADLILVAREQFCEKERAEIGALPENLQLEGFYRAWTAREALVKATGEGLSGELQRLRVKVDPREPARLMSGFGAYQSWRWRLCAFALDDMTLGCLALDRPIIAVNAYAAEK